MLGLSATGKKSWFYCKNLLSCLLMVGLRLFELFSPCVLFPCPRLVGSKKVVLSIKRC